MVPSDLALLLALGVFVTGYAAGRVKSAAADRGPARPGATAPK